MSARETNAGGASIAERCLEQLRHEDTFWARVAAVLHGVHQALTAGQWSALSDSGPAQEQLAQESEHLRAARRQLRADVGAVLGVAPEMLTVEQIARRLSGPDRQRLLEARDQLRSRAREAQRISQACAIVAQYHLEFVQRFFAELTGSADGARYGPEGTLRPAACRSLLQARG